MKTKERERLNPWMGCLPRFLEAAQEDARIAPAHISLFAALLFSGADRLPGAAFQIDRSQVMKTASIRSRATYHRYIRDLHQWGYLRYIPSCNPRIGSLICLPEVMTSK